MNDFSILQDKTFLQCYQDRRHYKTSVDWKLFTWEDVIHGIDQSTCHDSGMHILNNFGMIIHNAERDHRIEEMLNNFSELDLDYDTDARWFISMTSISECFSKHNDYYEVWYWQVIGEINWSIWDRGIEHKYTLKPNDLVYVPKDMYHQTSSIMPRAGISFGINKNKKIT
jgi:hypothetical protein